jgi:hypothetical protein
MKNLLIAVAVVFATTSVAFAQTAKTSGPTMTFKEETYNYGTIKAGTKVDHIFEFTNTGSEPLIISNATGSCGCTVPEYPKQPIKKGEKASIKVSFDSTGRVGLQEKTVTIASNATSGPKVLYIKGTVEQAPVNIEPEARPMEKPQN